VLATIVGPYRQRGRLPVWSTSNSRVESDRMGTMQDGKYLAGHEQLRAHSV